MIIDFAFKFECPVLNIIIEVQKISSCRKAAQIYPSIAKLNGSNHGLDVYSLYFFISGKKDGCL